MNPHARVMLLACAALVLAGCAGFRGGLESVAYVGDTSPDLEPASSAYEASARPPLVMPGMTVRVAIDNRVRDYDTQVWLFVLPAKVDLRDVNSNATTPGRTRVRLAVTPTREGIVFSPRQAVLSFGGREYPGVGGSEFAEIESGEKGATQWEYRPIQGELALPATGQPSLLSVEFDVPPPAPERTDITLDLSRALHSPGLAAAPLIRFVPVRWKEGYT